MAPAGLALLPLVGRWHRQARAMAARRNKQTARQHAKAHKAEAATHPNPGCSPSLSLQANVGEARTTRLSRIARWAAHAAGALGSTHRAFSCHWPAPRRW